jgi:hypothetical protein
MREVKRGEWPRSDKNKELRVETVKASAYKAQHRPEMCTNCGRYF